MRSVLPLLAALVLLPACAADKSKYPSLARRPIERSASESPAPAPIATPTPAPAELLDRIAGLLKQARQADAGFRSVEPRARALVGTAQGSAVASEAWSNATVALAELDAARSEAMIALAELDAIYAARTVAGEDLAAIASARAQAIELVGSQDAVLATLRGQMPA